MREIIDAYLAGSEPLPSSQQPLIAVIALAFSLGFFETFSPCLIILLSFVLSYTIGGTNEFKKGILKVTTFGIGFLCAAVLLGLVTTLMLFSMPAIRNVLVWIVCIFAVLFGLNSLGFNLLKFLKIGIETKPLIRKLAQKYVFTYTGLCLLGFLFYFLDPCIAPIFFAILPLLTRAEFLLVLLVFCLGVMIPFIGIGFLAGSISKLVRGTYRHQSKIRAFSGLVLIAYALYLIVFYLII
jgi:cytochrome c biogenesis protein CcdA